MQGGIHFSSKELHVFTSKYARPEIIEHEEVSLKNDLYAMGISILDTARMKFTWQDPPKLYRDNRMAFLAKLKEPGIVVRESLRRCFVS